MSHVVLVGIRRNAGRSIAAGWAQQVNPGYPAQAWREVNWHARDRLADLRRRRTVLHKAVVDSRVIPLVRVNSHDFHQQYVAR
jgi:hypothetical protein